MVVKAFGAEPYESRRFRDAGRKLLKSNVRYVLQQAIASPLIEVFGAITIVVLMSYAVSRIKAETLTAGDFTSFVFALLLLYEPVKRLVGIHNIFEQALGASQKVFEYLDHTEEIVEKPHAHKLDTFQQEIIFDNVAFRYPSAPNGFQIHGLGLEVKAGEVVALVGPSGGGKTTLANLLPRFYDVSSGSVRVDGRDVRDPRPGVAPIADRHRGAGHVPVQRHCCQQHRYGRPGIPVEDLRRASETALAHEFILRLPDGYDTIIGDRGIRLSGGQRQRIAIARALLKNAPILILDEATSHLDTESEMLVQRALANLMEHRTVIVIAHTASPRFAAPIRSWCWNAAAFERPEPMKSSSAMGGFISGCTNCSSKRDTPAGHRWWICERTEHDRVRPGETDN